MRTGPIAVLGGAVHWYVDVLKKYTVFSGRARRQEYWMFTLISVVISIVLLLIDKVLGTNFIQMLYGLAVLLPSLAVGARRLHDTDRSGWWLLISLIPLVGVIILIVFLASDTKPHDNAYGPNPKQVPAY
jgi:uncharacterized membrane protein YhaH (DUF805 family)